MRTPILVNFRVVEYESELLLGYYPLRRYPSQLVVSMIPGGQLDGHATIGLRSFTFHSGSVYTRITETDQSKYPNEIDPVFEVRVSCCDVSRLIMENGTVGLLYVRCLYFT